MVDIARELFSEGFEVIIVNDGSPKEYDEIFDGALEWKSKCREKGEKTGKSIAFSIAMR